MFTKITIKSNNSDFKGVWKKFDTETEMNELGIKIMTSNDWIEYLIDHVFSDIYDNDVENALNAFISNDTIEEMKISIDGLWIRIIKEK